ncbi:MULTISPECIES: hypothetical protein [unclassified Oceanispirochaeta]|uniref:hypothetical protein n=1 Tax=unclassified Oceanispirochaeta TaxID=2635722 RepID=UPI000E08DA4A|nr:MULTISPECIES: hypothetical protein [unclassified Oceanispirochaeta]MBF9017867.1 hypothetical protein [Oceanispirochaeta sp. M2]NPD74378.1 hypothetical protein [Oceanispirochaeta sp. M1]RDG29764.1 hypothetical protein DV872_19945 [Oceanispirochaeta sp. M1]
MRKFIIAFLALFFIGSSVFAEDVQLRSISEIIIVQNEPVRTNEGALRRFLDFEVGQVFTTPEELTIAVDTQIKDLKNTRYFSEVEITVEDLEAVHENVPVVVTVTTTDGWTLVPIPYPIPDSQIGKNGWEFGAEITYDNAFGSMYDFYLDGFVDIAFGEETKLKKWKLNPEIRNIDRGNWSFDIAYEQVYSTNKKENPEVVGDYYQLYTKNSSYLSLATTLDLEGDWSYEFTPAFGFNYGYDWQILEDGNNLATDESGNYKNREDFFSTTLDHYINYGRVDWNGPYRNGYLFSLGNHNFINLSRPAMTADNSIFFITDIEGSAAYYKHFWKRLNYYTKASALIAFNDIYKDLGDSLRGVKNSSMSGNAGFFWQNTLAIQPFRERPGGFNFQIHPFGDVGFAFDYRDVGNFADILRFGAGSEFVFMIGSIDLKARLGYDFSSGFIDFNFGTSLSY